MNNKIKYFIYSISALLTVILLPVLLDCFLFNNSVQSSLTNGEWSSFLGSYIGGVVGGVGTLLAVVITTNETRKIQRHTQEEINADRALASKKERKQFSDEIAKIVSKYISNIRLYFDSSRALLNHRILIKDLKKDLQDIEKTIKEHYDSASCVHFVKSLHEKEKANLNKKLLDKDTLSKAIDQHQAEISKLKVDREVALENYFLLKIYLANVNMAQDLLEKLEDVHAKSTRLNIEEDEFSSSIENLKIATTDFCSIYTNAINDQTISEPLKKSESTKITDSEIVSQTAEKSDL